MLAEYPVDFDAEAINFHLNESCHCLGNEILALAASEGLVKDSCDTCHRAEGAYVREATAEDLEELKLRVAASDKIIEVPREMAMIPEAGK